MIKVIKVDICRWCKKAGRLATNRILTATIDGTNIAWVECDTCDVR